MKKIFSVLFWVLVSLVVAFVAWILGIFVSMMLLGAVCWAIEKPTEFITEDFISGFFTAWIFSAIVFSYFTTIQVYKKKQNENLNLFVIENIRQANDAGEVATLTNGTCSHCGRTGLSWNSNFCDRCSYTFVTVADLEQKLVV